MNQGNIDLNDPKTRQMFEQFCQMYNHNNQMNNPMMMNNMNMGMGQMNMGMGQMNMGFNNMCQMPMGQMNMGMGQMNMGFNNMGQMPMGMGQMNMGFNNMGQMPMGMGQMNNMNMNNMFMMYMNNPQCFNNQNFNINNSMRNLNSQISNCGNLNNVNNPMSYSTGNVVVNPTQPTNNNDDKGVLPRIGNPDDESALPVSGDIINVKFDASTGIKKIIRADKNKTTLKQLLKMYMDKIGLSESLIGKQVVFLYCGEKVDIESTKTLDELHIRNMSSITVFDQGNVIGAKLK